LVAVQARGDDPVAVPPPVSTVRIKLDAAIALKERLRADLVRDYEAMEAEHLADAAQIARSKDLDDRWNRAITPSLEDLLAAASGHPEDSASVEALGFVAQNARGLTTDQSRRALVALGRDHVRAPNISTVTQLGFLHYDKPEATAWLQAVVAENPSRAERGRACNDLAWLLSHGAGRIDRSDRSPGEFPRPESLRDADPVAWRREAEALYDRCASEFADVPLIDFYAGKTVGDLARGALFGLRHLRVGQVAPEITGQDVEGHPLRLGDYRGQVVVLIFSGEWCGPCRVEARSLRDLLQPAAQELAPCVVLEVNTDATRDPLRKAITAGDIAWPCWFDGGVTGPITLAWGVESFPLIYVLDQDGIIRAKETRGAATAAAVAKVLKTQTVGK